jgi:hypothetical protein
LRRLSQDLKPAHAEDITDNSQQLWDLRARLAWNDDPRRHTRRNTMYYAITTTFAALTIFTPAFIAMRDRTNSNWRSR